MAKNYNQPGFTRLSIALHSSTEDTPMHLGMTESAERRKYVQVRLRQTATLSHGMRRQGHHLFHILGLLRFLWKIKSLAVATVLKLKEKRGGGVYVGKSEMSNVNQIHGVKCQEERSCFTRLCNRMETGGSRKDDSCLDFTFLDFKRQVSFIGWWFVGQRKGMIAYHIAGKIWRKI